MDQPKPEIMARARTCDDVEISLWSDGTFTRGGRLGLLVKGVGSSHSSWAQRRDVDAGWLVIGEAGLFDYAEIPAAVKLARKLCRLSGWPNGKPSPGDFREEAARVLQS